MAYSLRRLCPGFMMFDEIIELPRPNIVPISRLAPTAQGRR